jgi:glycosyltransferase involved in cell wall biosynthesis
MRIAFYAPLKPPDHPTPSGDRRVAQLLLEALRAAGHSPFVASVLRSYDGEGREEEQARLAGLAHRECERLLADWRADRAAAPQLWFTYHVYYKAPDWLGPAVRAALGIPYVVAEASVAPKRAGGPWDSGHRAVNAALRAADLVFGLNATDRACVLPLLQSPERWVSLPPFLDASRYPAAPRSRNSPLRLITVAMMRPGDKLASYRVLCAALARLLDLEWTLEVVGDGPARASVESALLPLGERVIYCGALQEAEIARALSKADLFVWPAINEAFGMALLEAQACGLPVVAGDSGGVAGIVATDRTGLLVPPGDVAAFATAIRQLLVDAPTRRRMAAAARRKVLREHDLPVAAARLASALTSLRSERAA